MAQDGLKIPHVQRVKGKGGAVYLYFRKGGYREGPLASADGTSELKAEVDAILARIARAEAAIRKPLPGTIGGMLAAYNKTADFLSNKRVTQKGYQAYIDEMKADIGDVLLSEVSRAWVIDLRDAWAPRGHNAANKRMQVLRNALAPAIEDEADTRIKGDPFHKVKAVRRPNDAGESHPVWDDAEVEAAIEDAIARKQPGLARAIALGRYGGFRRGTICALPRHARTIGYDDDGQPQPRIVWMTEKRQVLSDKREDPRLSAIIAKTPSRALTVAYNARGEPWRARQLSQALERLLDRLAEANRVRAALDEKGRVYCPLSLHGLRHSRGVELALAGASDAEIMSQLEHATAHAAKIYRRQASRRQMADAGQDRVDKVISLRARREAQRAGK